MAVVWRVWAAAAIVPSVVAWLFDDFHTLHFPTILMYWFFGIALWCVMALLSDPSWPAAAEEPEKKAA